MVVNLREAYYAIGNVAGTDALAYAAQPASRALPARRAGSGAARRGAAAAVFLGAAGDVRNVLSTAAAFFERSGSANDRLVVVLNDLSTGMLARDVLLLSMAVDGDTPTDVAAVWGSLALTEPQRETVDALVDQLADGALPPWLLLPRHAAAEAETAVRDAARAWRRCTPTSVPLATVSAQRRAGMSVDVDTRVVRTVVELSTAALQGVVAPAALRRMRPTLEAYADSGSLAPASDAPFANVTLLEPPALQWTLYWSSSIFRSVDLSRCGAQPGGRDAGALLAAALEPQLAAVRALVRAGRLQIALFPGDILDCMSTPTPPEFVTAAAAAAVAAATRDGGAAPAPDLVGAGGWNAVDGFDVVDVSNVPDVVSLPAVLLCAAHLLRRDASSVVVARSMQWRGSQHHPTGVDPAAYVSAALGVSLAAWSKLTGLDLVSSAVARDGVVTTTWGLSVTPPPGLASGNDLARFALHCCKRAGSARPGGDAGTAAASAGTLAVLLTHAARNGSGGMRADGAVAADVASAAVSATAVDAALQRLLRVKDIAAHAWELEALTAAGAHAVLTSPAGDETPHRSLVVLRLSLAIDYIGYNSEPSSTLQLAFLTPAAAAAVRVGDALDTSTATALVDSFSLDPETGDVVLLLLRRAIDSAVARRLAATVCIFRRGLWVAFAQPVPVAAAPTEAFKLSAY